MRNATLHQADAEVLISERRITKITASMACSSRLDQHSLKPELKIPLFLLVMQLVDQ